MFKIMSDLNLCDRITRPYASAIIATAKSGMFLTLNASEELDFVTSDGASGAAYPIWVEGNRDGTVGFSPDVTATGKLTVLKGGARFLTDQVTNYAGLAIGESVVAGANGTLVEYAAVTHSGIEGNVVGWILAKHDTVTYLGTTFSNVVEVHTK